MINFLFLLIIGCILWYVITFLAAEVISDPKVLKGVRMLLALLFLILIFYYGWPYLGDDSANYHIFHHVR